MSKTTSYHFCINIRGMLEWPKKDLKKAMRKEDGSYLTPDEVRDFLFDRLSEGKKVLPLGECDNFCFEKGCRGHALEESR